MLISCHIKLYIYTVLIAMLLDDEWLSARDEGQRNGTFTIVKDT